jgi:hypothetical protein
VGQGGSVEGRKLEADGRSSRDYSFRFDHLQTWLPQAIPVLDWSISKNLLI